MSGAGPVSEGGSRHRARGVSVDRGGTSASVRSFYASAVTVLLLFAVLAFVGMYVRTVALVEESALETARSYVDLIISARQWNAVHSGAWVEKSPGVESNPYLLKLGVSPDVTTTAGTVLTLRNPALMTREISELQRARGGATFHLTALRPVNPENTPDDWERGVLITFAGGTMDAWHRGTDRGVPVLRYMRRLSTESSCLRCHADYRVGSVRGAISVDVPLAAQDRALAANAAGLAVLGVLATSALLALNWLLVRRMQERIESAQDQLVTAATVDPLTGCWTRGYAMDRLQAEIGRTGRDGTHLGVLIADIDHFKQVNDVHGHATGDEVLTQVAERLRSVLRPYDGLGRIGGEEFVIVAPDVDEDGVVALGERLRLAVCADPIIAAGSDFDITVSIGVTLTDAGEPDALDHALVRADDALYAAKRAGRDRVSALMRPAAAD